MKYTGVPRAETVVVTGASSGVGRAVARAFGRRGARVGLVARGRQGLAGAKREIEEAGGDGLVLPGDVANPDTLESAAQAVEEALGPIDVWINDAMVTVFAPFHEIEAEEFRRATEVTYLGTVYGTMAALRRMRPRNRGTIIQVGSAMAYRGIPLQAPYCGAKHAIKGFTESLRTELRHDGVDIHVGMVQLPGLNTPQFLHCRSKMPKRPQPVPPIFEPEVAAEAVLTAVDQRRREMYVGLPSVATIFGNKAASWLVERYLARTGFSSQQTQEPASPDRPDNLFEASPGDPGARGPFDQRAHEHSIELWATRNRSWIAIGASAAVALSGAVIRR